MPLRTGETFAGYRVVRLLGTGGMGEVYLVRHPRLPRQEALKVLRPDISSDGSFRERFVREADLAAGLRHPHIVGVHDRGEHEGRLWIAMDFIEGTDAARLVQQRYPAGMPIDGIVSITIAVASALDYAHKKALFHRDVKPANIIVADIDDDDPSVFLADFGIARPADDTSGITTTNMTVGTVAYAAPEQLMGEPIDGRADQYALAASTYQLLTGMQLFPHSNAAVVISRHLSAPVPALADSRPELASLDPVLAAALAKAPSDRFDSCTAFARALAETATPRSRRVIAAPTTPAPVARRPLVSHSTLKVDGASTQSRRGSASSLTLWKIGGVVATALLLIGALGLWRPWQHPLSSEAVIASSSAPTASRPASASDPAPRAIAPPAAPTSARLVPSLTSTAVPRRVVRTPTVYQPGDEIPHIDGADWAGYARAMERGLSPDGYQRMFGVIFTDSGSWVCTWVGQGADQAAVAEGLVGKYPGLSSTDAGVIYRSAMDWVCP